MESNWWSVIFLYLHRFFRLGKFSSMILLNIFSVPLSCISSPSSIPIILKFVLFIVSQISWMFCVKNLLDLMFSLANESIFFYCIFNTWDSFFYLMYSVCYSCLCSSCSFTQIFHIQNSLGLCFLYYPYFSLQVLTYLLHLFVFSLFSWVSLNDLLISSNFLFVFSSVSLREFFCFLFKGLHHLHIVKFKDVFFFFCVRMIKSSCFVFAWFWCYHVVF